MYVRSGEMRDPLDPLDPLSIDRELRRSAREWRLWRQRLRRGAGIAEDPFVFTKLAGLTAFQAVTEAPAEDPLREPLRRWIYRLAEQRINLRVLSIGAFERTARPYALDAPEKIELSLGQMLTRALADAPKRQPWIEVFGEHAGNASQAAAILWERRHEIARRMGLGSPDDIEAPNPNVAEVARRWLARSDDAARELLPRDGLVQLIDPALGIGAVEGWPARLDLRTLVGWFRETKLFQSLDLDTGPMPAAIGPASFVRGLARLGATFVDAAAPAHQPFVVAHDPYGLRRFEYGALLASLAADPAFTRRALGLDRRAAEHHRRAVLTMLLVASRSAALKVLLRAPALAGQHQWSEAFQEHVESTFGFAPRPETRGVLWRLDVDDGQRFAGLLLAAGASRRMVEAHDEDWFRNPRATEELRCLADSSPDVRATDEQLDEGVEALALSIIGPLER